MCHQSTLYHSVTRKAARLVFGASRLDHTSRGLCYFIDVEFLDLRI